MIINKNNILNLFLGLFIFTTINKSFRLFGLDTRYVGGILIVVLLVFRILDDGFLLKIYKKDIYILCLYFVIFFSLIQWNWNGISIYNSYELMNLIILNAYNFAATLVIILYRDFIDLNYISKCIVISGLVLAISMAVVYSGITIPSFLIEENARVNTVGTIGFEHFNLFGQQLRVSGLAEDANYATLFCTIAAVYAYQCRTKTKYLVFQIMLLLFGVSISFSKTVILGTCLAVIAFGISKLLRAQIKNFEFYVFVCIFILAIEIPYLGVHVNLQTIATRFRLWNHAKVLFENNPLFGCGLGSFRYYNDALYGNRWMVQSHSTFWQVLSEVGIIGALVFTWTFYMVVRQCENDYSKFLLFLYIFFAFNFETFYLQYFVLVMCFSGNSKRVCYSGGQAS